MKITLDPKLTADPAFIATSAAGRGTWFVLLLWCAEQENAGIINGAASWSNEAWGMLGVSKDAIAQAGRLVTPILNDIFIWGYPVEQERVIAAKRAGGKARAASLVNIYSTPRSPRTPDRTPKTPLVEPVKKPIQTNEEWLADLKSNPLFKTMDIDREREKAALWCQNNSRQMTRKFFLNWLNKADKPLPTNGHTPQERKREVRF